MKGNWCEDDEIQKPTRRQFFRQLASGLAAASYAAPINTPNTIIGYDVITDPETGLSLAIMQFQILDEFHTRLQMLDGFHLVAGSPRAI